jgi:protein-S-isoprenylcysteine O-methyltransferase Ste14
MIAHPSACNLLVGARVLHRSNYFAGKGVCVRASAFEFRFRAAIIVAIVALGAWSPWIDTRNIARRISLLEWSALQLSRLDIAAFTVATPIVIVAICLLAALAVALRVWGTAYLGPGTVNSMQMKSGILAAGGPYRYVRNPLYLGTWCMVAAITFILPPTGSLVVFVLLTIFLPRLILGEESFLAASQGEAYAAYMRAVPRLIPRLRTTMPRARLQPQWLRALLSELNPIGVFITFAVFSWTYNNRVMTKSILISFGISLIMRAVTPSLPTHPDSSE